MYVHVEASGSLAFSTLVQLPLLDEVSTHPGPWSTLVQLPSAFVIFRHVGPSGFWPLSVVIPATFTTVVADESGVVTVVLGSATPQGWCSPTAITATGAM